jgi:P-type E1-E2 ATPase
VPSSLSDVRAGVEEAFLHGLAVLLVSCPCALGIAAPLVTWVAIGRAARRGILIHSAEVFEPLARRGRAFFDKTGTLTSSRLEVCGAAVTSNGGGDGTTRK